VAVSYEATPNLYVYASYAEGFGAPAAAFVAALGETITLDPQVVDSRELGIRSDWLYGRLRFNATYFDARWNGFRVQKFVDHPTNPGQVVVITSDDGVAASSGLEAQVSYLPNDRWELGVGIGLLDTEYLEIGVPPANGTGLQPGTPFAFAPEHSYSLTLRYRLPLAGGGNWLFAGDYGWRDEYETSPANQFQSRNPDGSRRPEPAYGVLNARVVFQPASPTWQVALFGTNLTNEWYIASGADLTGATGYAYGIVGRPREIGASVQLAFD
jgi:iron complex outermembrane receptor protein